MITCVLDLTTVACMRVQLRYKRDVALGARGLRLNQAPMPVYCPSRKEKARGHDPAGLATFALC